MPVCAQLTGGPVRTRKPSSFRIADNTYQNSLQNA